MLVLAARNACPYFLLLECYVPNVAKRNIRVNMTSVYVQCESKKNPPLRFSGIFPLTVGHFLSKFYTPVICSYVR